MVDHHTVILQGGRERGGHLWLVFHQQHAQYTTLEAD
jgi:hypothetical protein